MDRLTAAFEKKFPKEKTELLVKAINFAKSVHADQKRESQEPYYIHPEAVALILLDMDMDADTVIAGLLHDTVEDGHDITVEKIAQMFGKDIARMVDGVTKLTNSIMLDGKKGVAQKVVYGAFDIIKDKTEKDPLEVFTQAMENIMPSLEVKARRVGGATYQVPMEVRPARRQTLGLRWLTNYSRARGERTMAERLAGEIMDAANNTGSAVKKREDTHKMAESNKAFAHFRW